MRIHWGLLGSAAALAVAIPQVSSAREASVALRDSFPIGTEGGLMCQVQDRSVSNPARRTIFDRRWAVVCRDAALPVATIYAFKQGDEQVRELVGPYREERLDCSAAAAGQSFAGIGPWRFDHDVCKVEGTALDFSVATTSTSGFTYLVEGFSAYDPAARLAIASILEDHIVEGVIDVSTTMASDPFAFARAQAQTLDPSQALAEGYRRNLAGDYAEAAAYFETLANRPLSQGETKINPGEFTINRALQLSNLGEFGTARRLFDEARPITAGEPVAERLQRNFEAIHLLNQGRSLAAIARVDQPLSAQAMDFSSEADRLEISLPLAERLNGSGDGLFGFVDELRLTARERAAIIDAQAQQLKGIALRIEGDNAGAREALLESYARAIAVRDGRVTSIVRLRAQTLAELALIAELESRPADAEGYLRNAIALLQLQYPRRPAVRAMNARLASFLLRQDRRDEALALYRQVIDEAAVSGDAVTGFSNQLLPYFRELAPMVETDGAAADDFFQAVQLLVRPGVAETQAILARELSAGDREAARLFRQSTDLARDIERLRFRLQALAAAEVAEGDPRRVNLATELASLEQAQLRTQVQLNDYPQYRVVTPRTLALGDFKAALEEGEAFARIAPVGNRLFMFWTDSAGSKAWQLDMSEEDLAFEVDMLRASISIEEGGQLLTYPYDVARARGVHTGLFAPVAARLANTRHLVFEPDAALLRLPLELLVSSDQSVSRYEQRLAAGGDAYDFTGVDWLGRETLVSTAVSAQAFVDARRVPRSAAGSEYLGLGENARPDTARAAMVSGSDKCGWSLATWQDPIDDAELQVARALIGEGRSSLLTGASFTDEALLARSDIDDFRVLHFATHGLVTPPNPECPARPALLTSFGGQGSDGLLSFDEIFELDIDADLVILSACDTAGGASIEATRSAGVGSGGGTALDGLVRSFIGAGARAVLASHWPVPDDYRATERLVSEMFRRGRSEDIGDALRGSQQLLMDDPETSHPYYWAGFAVIGDAARPLLSDRGEGTAEGGAVVAH